jgi:hypothetical protein
VISTWLISCHGSLSDNGAQQNAAEQVKKNRFDFYRCVFTKDFPLGRCRNRFARRENPIPALKKKRSNSDRQAPVKDSLLSRVQDRFARRENPPNTEGVPLLCKRRNRRRNGYTLTTSHLLLLSQRGKAAFLLPISQPNPNSAGYNYTEKAEGGGGGQPDAAAESVIPITSDEILLANGPLINS